MTLSPLYSTSHIFKSQVAKTQTGLSHKVQLYLDYDCPFSAKIFHKISTQVVPLIDEKHPGKFEFILMNVPQPWHPVSTQMHEMALAVGKLQPQSFIEFSELLFKNQESYYESEVYNKTKSQIYKELAQLASQNFDISEEKLLSLVLTKPSLKPSNGSNEVVTDLKYFIRYHRTVGIHVTPTVSVDGIVNGSIESSTDPNDIVKTLENYL